MSHKNRKAEAEPAPLQDCPITGLPINDKLVKKLKVSAQVTKKTLQNTLQNKLGWPAHKIQETWTKDTLIMEYYTALEMKKATQEAAASSPARSAVSSPAPARWATPAKAAPTASSSSARKQAKSTHGRPSTSSAASASSAGSRRESAGSDHASPALPAKPFAPRTLGTRRHNSKTSNSGFQTALTMLFVLLATFAFMVYMVHGFEGAQKLVAGSKGGVAHYADFVKSTFMGFETLVFGYNPHADVHGIVATKELTKKHHAAFSPTVTVVERAQESETAKARTNEERRIVADKIQAAPEWNVATGKVALAVRDTVEAQQREREHKKKEDAQLPVASNAKQQNVGPTDMDKVMQESCDSFYVYDCHEHYPKHYDACRTKKISCGGTLNSKVKDGAILHVTSR